MWKDNRALKNQRKMTKLSIKELWLKNNRVTQDSRRNAGNEQICMKFCFTCLSIQIRAGRKTKREASFALLCPPVDRGTPQEMQQHFPLACWCHIPAENKARVFPVDIRMLATICLCNTPPTYIHKHRRKLTAPLSSHWTQSLHEDALCQLPVQHCWYHLTAAPSIWVNIPTGSAEN